MKYVTFNDRSIDTRTLGPEDLEKAGVEGFEETDFHRGQPVEVKVAVAKALVDNPDLFGSFTIDEDITPEEQAEADAAAAAQAAEKAAAEAVETATGASQESVSEPKPKGSNRASTP